MRVSFSPFAWDFTFPLKFWWYLWTWHIRSLMTLTFFRNGSDSTVLRITRTSSGLSCKIQASSGLVSVLLILSEGFSSFPYNWVVCLPTEEFNCLHRSENNYWGFFNIGGHWRKNYPVICGLTKIGHKQVLCGTAVTHRRMPL